MTAAHRPQRTLAGTLSRFSLVGIAATTAYFLLANLFILSGAMGPAAASVVAYLLAMGVSFLGQSRFTFGVTRRTHGQFLRFCVLSACGIALSWGSVRLALHLGAAPFWGTLATSMLVPVLSFVVMKLWVFDER